MINQLPFEKISDMLFLLVLRNSMRSSAVVR